MPRIFLPLPAYHGTIRLRGANAHYLSDVLRCVAGDELIILDGTGGAYKTIIGLITSKEVLVEVVGKLNWQSESPIRTVLIQGILKGEKMDFVIQKATELGITEIHPVITKRSQIQKTRKIVRWRKIAEEASRQSGRSVVPLIGDLVSLYHFFSARHMKGLIFYEGTAPSLRAHSDQLKNLGSIAIAVGPEGGFTKEEVEFAESKGLAPVSLGRRILRAETAALSALTIVQYLWGDLSGEL